MKKKSFLRVAVSGLLCFGVLGVTACSAENSNADSEEVIGSQIIAPITMEIAELHGKTVQLMVGQVLNVNTGERDPVGFTGESSDPLVAEFQPGNNDGSAVFNPGVTGLSSGSAQVTMSSSDGTDTAVEFTVTVIASSAK